MSRNIDVIGRCDVGDVSVIAYQPMKVSTNGDAQPVEWEPVDIMFEIEAPLRWSDFGFKVKMVHSAGATFVLDTFWDGAMRRVARFAAPESGEWSFSFLDTTRSIEGPVLGTLNVNDADDARTAANSNLRGHLSVSNDGLFLEHRDGTPFFWIGDTNWALNTLRCGLSPDTPNRDGLAVGPFYAYVEDRKAKGFSVIQTSLFRSYLGAPQRNEGGYPFPSNTFDKHGQQEDNADFSQLNPMYFRHLDIRMSHLFDKGFVVAAHPNWLGRHLAIGMEDAVDFHRYILARYGAFNLVYSISGEYDRATAPLDPGSPDYLDPQKRWTVDQFRDLGRSVSEFNVYGHPLAIHPSSRDESSARFFHEEKWIDVNWSQVGEGWDKQNLWKIRASADESRSKQPPKPIVHSEGQYERNPMGYSRPHRDEVCGRATVRYEAWAAIMSGACGHTYGANGLWQFSDPFDSTGDRMRSDLNPLPWWDAMELPGAVDVGRVREYFYAIGLKVWAMMVPMPSAIRIDGNSPRRECFSDPFCLMADSLIVVYIPAGNRDKTLAITVSEESRPSGSEWFDPSSGQTYSADVKNENGAVLLPSPPKINRDPEQDDWVFLVRFDRRNRQ